VKKTTVLFCCSLLFCGNVFSQNGAFKATDTLKTVYDSSACGLNYVTASVLLSKKLEFNGLPFSNGADQPANLTISGISASSTIIKAFIWWDLTGKDTTGSVIIQNPSAAVDTINGVWIGGTSSNQECWTIGASAFRADITSVVTGNGTYTISGLPTDSIANDSTVDVNGATLFIIYRDSLAPYIGNFIINDGFYLAKLATVTQTISGVNASDTGDFATAFMLVSDMQNEAGSALKMNNGSYQGIVEDFWDFEERSTLVLQGQSTATFGIQVPNDCANFIMIGLYYQFNIDNTLPVITSSGDLFSSSSATNYQWHLNGVPISGANSQNYTATQAGTYSVTVDNDGKGCWFTSDTMSITCIINFTPSIFASGGIAWTIDSANATFQWYLDSNMISGATNSTYSIVDTGIYYVEVTDSLGCVRNSDTLFVNFVGIFENNQEQDNIQVYPNPNNGEFSLIIGGDFKMAQIQLVDSKGQEAYSKMVGSSKEHRLILPKLPAGVYFLKFVDEQRVVVKKVIFL